MAMNEKGLVKIQITLDGDSDWKSETVWAEPLGDDLYELWNMLWLAHDLHLRDVVRCKCEPGQLPEFVEVVDRSGHDTLHLIFTERAPKEVREEALQMLEDRVGITERASEQGWAVDVPPGADRLWAFEYLGELQEEGFLAGPESIEVD